VLSYLRVSCRVLFVIAFINPGFTTPVFAINADVKTAAADSQYADVTASASNKTDSSNIEELDVYGAQQPVRTSISEVDIKQYTGFAYVIDRSDFEDRLTTVSELLSSAPSLQFSERGGFGSSGNISLRGSTGKQVNFYLDGMLTNSPLYGSNSVQNIPLVLVSSIEIFPDFTPIQLDGANLAGAVNFKTRRLKKGEQGGEISLSKGSFDLQHTQISHWSNINNWDFIVGANYATVENDYPLDETRLQQDLVNCTKTCPRLNDAYSNKAGFLKLKKYNEDSSFSLLLHHQKADKELPTTKNAPIDNANLTRNNSRIQSIYDYKVSNWSLSHRISAATENGWYTDNGDTVGLSNFNNINTKIHSYNFHNVADYQSGPLPIHTSLSYRYDGIRQDDRDENERLIKGQRDTLTGGAGLEYSPHPTLLVTPSIRFQHINDTISFNHRDKDKNPEGKLATTSFHIGLRWRASKKLLLKANIANNTRMPNLLEKYGFSGLSEGNLELQPEKARASDIGFEFNLPNFSWLSSIYHKKISDGIFNVYASGGVSKPKNIGSANIYGIESSLRYHPHPAIELSFKGALIDSENTSKAKKASRGLKLPEIYHVSQTSSLKLKHQNMEWTSSYRWQGEMFYTDIHAQKADNIETFNSSITAYFGSTTLDLTGRNLSNKNYRSIYELPTPGRSIVASITTYY
jgi:iron complex outermembrane receptor protein